MNKINPFSKILLSASSLCFAFVLSLLPAFISRAARDIDYLAEYEAIRYSANDGLVSAEINTVVQTIDGYIWVGTYSGLYRYDGVHFEKVILDERICNVMVLYVDSKKRLWIGTNDSGLFCYEPESGSIELYDTDNGLSSYSIRSIAEDDDGNIYVGTVSFMTVIDHKGTARCLDTLDDIVGVRSLSHIGGNVIAGVTNGGLLFFIKDDAILDKRENDREGIYYTFVSRGSEKEFIAGTSAEQLEKMSFSDGKGKPLITINTEGVSYFNDILYDEEADGYFFCAENGMGFIDHGGFITYLMQNDFESSVSGVTKDYQGNIWFVSNKQGIMEYSPNPFFNVFVKAGLSDTVVNSILLHGSDLYIGSDSGLTVLDYRTYQKKSYDFVESLDGVRIRHMMEDSAGNVWISTYGKEGLFKISPSKEVTLFNESTAGTLGGRFRLSIELSDGTILAASNTGLNYIKDDTLIYTLGEDNGLFAPQILTMVECPDGSILAGSDGEGIFRIKDKKVTEHIGIDEGLETLVVMRIVPCTEGYIYVTSNALYYDDGTSIKRLSSFPYTNNYDVYITEDNEAWISSSAGIYIVKVDDLIGNGDYHYTLLDYSRGFNTTLTANAWNDVSEKNSELFLCCTDGVRRISTAEYNSFDDDYYIHVGSISYDDNVVAPDENGIYIIPAGARRIQIQASVLNYMLSNPLVHIYLEGADDTGTTVYQEELKALDYTNLPYGQYTLHIQILDSTEYTVLRDESFDIYKKAKPTELMIFRILLGLMGALLVGFIVWRFMQSTIIRRQYEEIRLAKEEADRANSAKSRFLANMSHEIRTPINTIMGMDEMILREDRGLDTEKYSASVTGYAKSIKQAAESLLGLVNDILDLSKIESGKMNLVEQEYDTVELFRSITTMIRVRSNEKDLGFSADIDPALPKRLYGDDGKIKQVILNLLTNAVKYTEEGSFTLNVNIREKKDDYCIIDYSVKDTGIGIKPEDMDKLFSAFERLDEKRNSGIQGTGLGLDISRQFVELMGDELKCESVYGEGSTFFFTLKQKIVSADTIGEFTEKDTSLENDGPYIPLFVAPDANILVVDDNEMNLKVLSGLLKATKVKLDTAMSGKECLKKLGDFPAKNPYHMVLLDHMMPEMDGIETLHELRRVHKNIPVIALTANAATSGENYYIGEGFQGYLSKPVDGRKLEEILAEYLPKALLQEPTMEDAVDKSADESLSGMDWLYKTEGLSVPEGIKNCGSAEAFLSTLNTFYNTLESNADEIENAYKNEDWGFYTVKVHALKSSARIIGAAKLSKLAESMENAGKENNIELIREDTGRLLTQYREYLERLSMLSSSEDLDDAHPEIDADTLSDAYNALNDLIPMMDYDSVEMVLESLKEYRLPSNEREKFKKLSVLLKELNWDKMAEILSQKTS